MCLDENLLNEAKKLFNKMKKMEEHGLYVWSTMGILSYLLAGGELL